MKPAVKNRKYSNEQNMRKFKFFGYKHVIDKDMCPATEHLECGKKGRFRNHCSENKSSTRNKKAWNIVRKDDSWDSVNPEDSCNPQIGHIQATRSKIKIGKVLALYKPAKEQEYIVGLKMEDHGVYFPVDAECEVSVLPKYMSDKLMLKPELKHTKGVLAVYGG